jgi:purine-binding chemotaxis protein CheW
MSRSDAVKYCTFTLDGLHFAVEVDRVQEVLHTRPMTTVPLADPRVRGIINLRGQVVTALDLRRRLGLESAPAAEQSNVVIRTDDVPVSLQVDAIGDVIDVPDTDLCPPPSTLQRSIRDLIRGIHPLANSLLLVLDVNRVLDFLPSHETA